MGFFLETIKSYIYEIQIIQLVEFKIQELITLFVIYDICYSKCFHFCSSVFQSASHLHISNVHNNEFNNIQTLLNMKIELLKLSLQNFKGITLSVDLTHETTILGANGSGKTRLYDSFLWLLFGKDSSGRSEFELKKRLPRIS